MQSSISQPVSCRGVPRFLWHCLQCLQLLILLQDQPHRLRNETKEGRLGLAGNNNWLILVDNLIPKHYLPPIIRLYGKLEMLDRLFPKLKATNIRFCFFFFTMTRLLDVMEEYLSFKQYWYRRLDGHTSGGDHGSLIDIFNKPDSPFFSYFFSGLEEHSFTGSVRLLLKIHSLSLRSFDSMEVFQHVFW